ncbi:hypothetical protein AQUCO_00201078v1 [Aquilegia coerulea]|uniref:KIB1-4 beta-propeller domain-containing protein n=1 Tax=Aquilegia coerulea TaxID=218851 RepID=A0A2G5F640_AQUCA|nr:hypothetical protein AQUCO_00201078v1 [Aquilegia coerulea]
MLFGLTFSDKLLSFDFSDLSKPLPCVVFNLDTVTLNVPDDELLCKGYLVESCGELLMVYRITNYIDIDDWICTFSTIKFLVYRLESIDQSNDLLQWVQLESLGDRILFLGRNASLSISATGIPGVKGNCIYFTADRWDYFYSCEGINSKACCSDNGIFYMDDGRIEPFFIDNDSQSIKCQPFWIMPHSIHNVV